MKNLFITSFVLLPCFLFSNAIFSQAPAIEWAKCYGTTGDDFASGIEKAFDDGYIILGNTESSQSGNEDILIVKIDDTGKVE